MCLEAIEKNAGEGKKALDIGCGSGILGIAACLMGCESCAGCDIDPKAPDVAVRNAALNGIGSERFRVSAGDILSDAGMRKSLGSGYDIVLANIVADGIITLAGIVRDFMAPDAVFICSGIIEGRQEEARRALLNAGFTVTDHQCLEEWPCFTAK
jgi:ribosomal protein L11 methyltransferase